MRNLNLVIVIVAVAALSLMFAGCGGQDNILSEMTGTWKSNQGSNPIKINLSGNPKTVEIGDNTVPVTIKKVDEGSYTVTVDAKPANGKTLVWSFREVWNDNGSAFTIRFDHDGEEETLTRG